VRYPEQSSLNKSDNHLYTVEIANTVKETITANNIVNNSLNSSVFHFDRVFTEASTQNEVFILK
jgi:hypothetical protein